MSQQFALDLESVHDFQNTVKRVWNLYKFEQKSERGEYLSSDVVILIQILIGFSHHWFLMD